jgi:group I intron endonuclease
MPVIPGSAWATGTMPTRLCGSDMIIYLVTNRVNGKIYIGKTRMKLNRRWLAHCRNAMSGSMIVLHCAIRKYGRDNFNVVKISEHSSLEELNRAEINAIERLRSNSIKVGYNRTIGGENGGTFLGRKHSAETKLKMSLCHKGKVFSEETRKRMSMAWKTRTISDATRLKMSASHIGRKKSSSHCLNISKGLTGKRHTPERINKMRIGRWG